MKEYGLALNSHQEKISSHGLKYNGGHKKIPYKVSRLATSMHSVKKPQSTDVHSFVFTERPRGIILHSQRTASHSGAFNKTLK
jgi:hypothetical protein